MSGSESLWSFKSSAVYNLYIISHMFCPPVRWLTKALHPSDPAPPPPAPILCSFRLTLDDPLALMLKAGLTVPPSSSFCFFFSAASALLFSISSFILLRSSCKQTDRPAQTVGGGWKEREPARTPSLSSDLLPGLLLLLLLLPLPLLLLHDLPPLLPLPLQTLQLGLGVLLLLLHLLQLFALGVVAPPLQLLQLALGLLPLGVLLLGGSAASCSGTAGLPAW